MKTMMHGVKANTYLKSFRDEEKRARAARKAAKHADGDKEKKNKCVSEVVAPSANGQKHKTVGLRTQAQRTRGADTSDTRVFQPSSASGDMCMI
jgi:hypothetical protein